MGLCPTIASVFVKSFSNAFGPKVRTDAWKPSDEETEYAGNKLKRQLWGPWIITLGFCIQIIANYSPK